MPKQRHLHRRDLPIMRGLSDAYRELIGFVSEQKRSSTDAQRLLALSVVQQDLADKLIVIQRNMAQIDPARP